MKVESAIIIEEIPSQLGSKHGVASFDKTKFDLEIFSQRYPAHIKKQIDSNRTVLFNSINIKKMTQSEIALLYSKDYSGCDTWKEEREKIENQYAKVKESDASKIEEGGRLDIRFG